jgi:carbamate kinase
MLVVVALGGNALLRRGQALGVANQRHNIAEAVDMLAELTAEHRIVVTHGNGPQVGLLALQAEAYRGTAPYPLDVLGAESEGMVGYLLEQAMQGRLPQMATGTLLTQTVVDRRDPAFEHPTKPIGPVYDSATAQRLAGERGWAVARDGDGWRRVVPSPEPQRIIELRTIRTLVDAGVLVICAGGGGIPVVVEGDGSVHGVEAVIDKDLSAALLARELGAQALLLLTDVPCLERDHGTPQAKPVREARVSELDPADFAAGSMRPKVEAARRFAARGGFAAIGALRDAPRILAGQAGTRVLPDNGTPRTVT